MHHSLYIWPNYLGGEGFFVGVDGGGVEHTLKSCLDFLYMMYYHYMKKMI